MQGLDANDVLRALISVFNVASGPPLTRFFEDRPHQDTTDTIIQLFEAQPSAWIVSRGRFNRNLHLGNLCEDTFVAREVQQHEIVKAGRQLANSRRGLDDTDLTITVVF